MFLRGVIIILFLGFIGADVPAHVAVLDQVRQHYKAATETCVAELDTVALFISERRPDSDIRKAFKDCRVAFKKTEWWLEYSDRGIYDWWNGVPLARPEESSPMVLMIPPRGLQVLEGILWEDTIDHESALKAIKSIRSSVKVYTRQSERIQSINEVYEALAFNLIRLEALTFAGFDSPASENSIPETKATLVAIAEILSLLDDGWEDMELLQAKFADAIQALSGGEVNRMDFLTMHFYPLKDQFNYWAARNGFKANPYLRRPVNLAAKTIYDNDFLDASYYSRSGRKDISPEIAALGKTLFFDPVMSENGKLSCASCHQPEKAFTDGLPKSLSNTADKFLQRNAPTLLHASLQAGYMYDLFALTLEDQMDRVFQHEMEFHTNYGDVVKRLKLSEEYVHLFKNAFPEQPEPVNVNAINTALASFVRSLTSYDSPFDRYMRGEIDSISAQAKEGFNLFMGKAKCGTCHFAPTFFGLVPPFYVESEVEILGVPKKWPDSLLVPDDDAGRFELYRADELKNAFKTSTVRNSALTAPYMHNGSMATLDDVLDFYNKGGGAGLGLDVPNQTLDPAPLNLDKSELAAIKAFIGSLNDAPQVNRPVTLPHFPESSGISNDRLTTY